MRRNFYSVQLVFTVSLILFSAFPLFAQTAPAAREGGLPLSIGAGMSSTDTDYINYTTASRPGYRMQGITVWADYALPSIRFVPRGFSLEAEGKTIRYGIPENYSRMREETALGGILYTWRHYRDFHPYVKGLMGVGSGDIQRTGYGNQDAQQTLMAYALGGGVEYRAFRHLWIRGEYELQTWLDLTNQTSMNPQGLTVGVMYNFRRLR
jgi:opacity protein-like surface antigen